MNNPRNPSSQPSSQPAPQTQSHMAGPRPGGPMGMRGFERPKDARRTLMRMLRYLDNRKMALVVVFSLMLVSTAAMLVGNYLLKPLINDYILPGDLKGLAGMLAWLAVIYLIGAAAAYLQMRLMVHIAQNTGNRIRQDLFVKLQSLPLKFFDRNPHGDLMSRFTNDIDNIQMALEQSLVQLVSSALTFVGSVVMMIVLSPVLFLITFAVLALMFVISGRIAGHEPRQLPGAAEEPGDRQRLCRGDGRRPEGHQGLHARGRGDLSV